MPDSLSLFSNGYGFYEALSATPYNLCKPQIQTQTQTQTQTHDNIEYRPELKIVPCDQSCATATRFFSPGEESCTPPGTPASTAASAPSPSTPTSTSTSTPTEMTTTQPGFESGFDESAESEGYPAPSPLSPTSILSTEDARQLMETYVRRSSWFQTNVPEPSVGDLGVPTCALLLARPGESVYRCFVDTRKDRKGRAVYYCAACGFKSDRLHRLVGHQRSKRSHRPFACPDHGWYVHTHPSPHTPLGFAGRLLTARFCVLL